MTMHIVIKNAALSAATLLFSYATKYVNIHALIYTGFTIHQTN